MYYVARDFVRVVFKMWKTLNLKNNDHIIVSLLYFFKYIIFCKEKNNCYLVGYVDSDFRIGILHVFYILLAMYV